MLISKSLEGKINSPAINVCHVKVRFVTEETEIALDGDFFSILFNQKITVSFIVNSQKDPFKILESSSATIIINSNIYSKEYLVDILSIEIEIEKNKDFKITIEAQKK